MYLIENYSFAVVLCVLTMICWGSWQNTQNLIGKSWRFELYYWDFSIQINRNFGQIISDLLHAESSREKKMVLPRNP